MIAVVSALLPHIDEHALELAAGPDAVWPALCDVVGASFAGPARSAGARVLGCSQWRTEGRIGEAGATLPGFRVAEASPPTRLALEGRHRFSRYALIFHLDELGSGRTRLRAETRAVFPGLAGRAYRAMVIGTGGHVVVVRRILRAVGRRAERR